MLFPFALRSRNNYSFYTVSGDKTVRLAAVGIHAMSFAGFRSSLPFSGLIRQLEQEMETVIKVLQPGPLGIIEHKFSAQEIREAYSTVLRAVANWRRHAILEERNPILKDYIRK